MNRLLILTTSVALLGACGDDDGGKEPGIMLMDAGPTVSLMDGGLTAPPSMDGDMDVGGGTTAPPTGACAMPPPDLREVEAMQPGALPRCAPETLSCIRACTADGCIQSCIDSDTTPPLNLGGAMVDCSGCITFQNLSCSAANGCESEYADFSCCLEGCAGDMACQQACPQMEFGACLQRPEVSMACGASLAACFGAAMPTPDPMPEPDPTPEPEPEPEPDPTPDP